MISLTGAGCSVRLEVKPQLPAGDLWKVARPVCNMGTVLTGWDEE